MCMVCLFWCHGF